VRDGLGEMRRRAESTARAFVSVVPRIDRYDASSVSTKARSAKIKPLAT